MGISGYLARMRAQDTLSKVAVVILVGTSAYVFLLFAFTPLLIAPDAPGAHTTVMGDHLMSFASPEQARLNLAALVGAILTAASAALLFGTRPHADPPIRSRSAQEGMEAMKKVLSDDERRLLSAIEEAGEITQDSLSFRLEWSRAKVSTRVTNLERLNLVQRRREGKTYVVFLAHKPGKPASGAPDATQEEA